MPKVEILHQETTPIPQELRSFLSKHFPETVLQKLERLGGRILLSIAAPYDKQKKKGAKPIVVDEPYVQHLHLISKSANDLRQELAKLPAKQLRILAKLLKHPVRSNATAVEIRTELLRSLTSEEFWKRISGSTESK